MAHPEKISGDGAAHQGSTILQLGLIFSKFSLLDIKKRNSRKQELFTSCEQNNTKRLQGALYFRQMILGLARRSDVYGHLKECAIALDVGALFLAHKLDVLVEVS